ncbi:hypothetical protein AG0111_0g13052 [Alternaria gaisen]|uniref:Uncharacterized protein n=1 Tax=Alternaria gaisen TaxID=167740 RepID=A0ACB6F2W0_9PLEO|nr:hypothetical protein AG0111_0g13052 [Alternaria gaisen]
MATHTDATPPYTPGTPEFIENTATTIEQVEAAHRATRLQRYLLEIIAHSLPVDMPKLVNAIPFEWPTYNGFRASLLQKKERAHLLHLSQTHTKHIPNKHSLQHHEHTCHNMSTRTGEYQHELDILDKEREVKVQEMKWQTIQLLVMYYMHRQIATSTLEDGRMLLVEAVEPSRTLNIDPGFTLQLMAAYADEHTKTWRQKRKRNLIADLVKYSYVSDTGSHTWLYLNVISQLVLQLSPNHVVQKTLGIALEKYGRGRQHRQLGFMTDLGPRNSYYKGYNSLAEFLSGIPMVGENGTWQQLLALVPYENPVVSVTPWMSR